MTDKIDQFDFFIAQVFIVIENDRYYLLLTPIENCW